ncbi:unnamed protein product [Penicillium nalgiovense]|nr:unnamed protein product [Penicillium nalgiovense]CAG8148126.1 unnamed protein product [Penicillium nalgiovense]CAG8278785.1 unnamed protein product [Penicillium nalgiovense]CAG8302449.1 unnamed protein product [Penicillium nalgiovense]CAG8347849.1 unnamed protein product [Penicillium nalgiovense]
MSTFNVPKRVIGPLHGIPITFKYSFDIKGNDTSIGITALCFSPSQRNKLLYDMLTGYGAVVIAKQQYHKRLSTHRLHRFGR